MLLLFWEKSCGARGMPPETGFAGCCSSWHFLSTPMGSHAFSCTARPKHTITGMGSGLCSMKPSWSVHISPASHHLSPLVGSMGSSLRLIICVSPVSWCHVGSQPCEAKVCMDLRRLASADTQHSDFGCLPVKSAADLVADLCHEELYTGVHPYWCFHCSKC